MTQCHPGITVQDQKTVSRIEESRGLIVVTTSRESCASRLSRRLSQTRRFFVVAENVYSSLEFPSASSLSTSALLFSAI